MFSDGHVPATARLSPAQKSLSNANANANANAKSGANTNANPNANSNANPNANGKAGTPRRRGKRRRRSKSGGLGAALKLKRKEEQEQGQEGEGQISNANANANANANPNDQNDDTVFARILASMATHEGTLSDRLNPKHAHFDQELFAMWSHGNNTSTSKMANANAHANANPPPNPNPNPIANANANANANPTPTPTPNPTRQRLTKSQRRQLVQADRRRIDDAQMAVRALRHAFVANPDDHCETSAEAYADIVPILNGYAKAIGKTSKELRIYDPYFCAGAVKKNLAELGFENV